MISLAERHAAPQTSVGRRRRRVQEWWTSGTLQCSGIFGLTILLVSQVRNGAGGLVSYIPQYYSSPPL